jgi:NTE family protein
LGALPRPVAVALGGGGVLGAAHVGVGYALEHRKFVPDLVVGTSVGALTGAIAAAYPDRAAPWLDHVWTHLRRRDVFPLGYLSSRSSIFTDRGLRRLIARAELPSRIEQLAIPFTGRPGAIAARAAVLQVHHQIESDLLDVSKRIPTVVLPTGVEEWPAPWDFSHSQRLINTASVTAGRFLDRLHIRGAGLYRIESPTSSMSGVAE